MANEEDFIELNKNYNTGGKCVARLFTLFLLPTLIYLIVILGYMGFFSVTVELHSVILIGAIFIIYINFIRHNAYYASCKFRKQYSDLKIQLKQYINKNSLEIDTITKANASVDDFLQEFTSSLRNTNFSSVAASIFPTLGILGTFISIAISMPDFSSQSSAQLEKEISMLLGGVGTAFYVSIYGIFLSLWWIFFEKLGMSRFEHDILIIKENTKALFWNKIDIDKIHFQKSIENYEKLNSFFVKIDSNELIADMNNVLTSRIKIFDDMIEAETKAIKYSTQQMEQRDLQHGKFMHSFEKTSLKMEDLSNVVSKTVKDLSSMSDHLSSKELHIAQGTKNLNDNIDMLNASLENVSSKNIKAVYLSIIKGIEVMKRDTSKISLDLETNLNNFDEQVTDKLKNSLEMIDSQTVEIIEQISKIKE